MSGDELEQLVGRGPREARCPGCGREYLVPNAGPCPACGHDRPLEAGPPGAPPPGVSIRSAVLLEVEGFSHLGLDERAQRIGGRFREWALEVAAAAPERRETLAALRLLRRARDEAVWAALPAPPARPGQGDLPGLEGSRRAGPPH